MANSFENESTMQSTRYLEVIWGSKGFDIFFGDI